MEVGGGTRERGDGKRSKLGPSPPVERLFVHVPVDYVVIMYAVRQHIGQS